MRKIHIILLVLVGLIVYSCKKTEDENYDLAINKPNTVSITSMKLIREVEDLPKSHIGLGYSKLTPEEKVVFWNRQIDNYLLENKVSDELKDHILKLKSFITVNLYENLGKPETEKLVDKFTKEWLLDPIQNGRFPAKTLISVSTLYGRKTKESSIKTLNTASYSTSSEQSITCDCYYSVYCQIGTGGSNLCMTQDACKTNSDNPFNCGITGTSRCVGRCE
ncbi:bacteriocin fulvocin C-related protein [Desertivirga arenae]|uniref:bacteriocin fulvocin C-related protein n=1 Tax=Desertivirga arenae TaxID=2810309 RepID=UPI001A95CD50|nr:bacteriocin fulvocin C-related protein [Pedobacter sp. SYSU D00823]